MGARSSLDLGSLGRSDQMRDQSASIGASALASQLLLHQQQVCNQFYKYFIRIRVILSSRCYIKRFKLFFNTYTYRICPVVGLELDL